MFAAIGVMFALIAYGVKFGDTVLLRRLRDGNAGAHGAGVLPVLARPDPAPALGIGIIAVGGLRSKAGRSRVPKFHWRADRLRPGRGRACSA